MNRLSHLDLQSPPVSRSTVLARPKKKTESFCHLSLSHSESHFCSLNGIDTLLSNDVCANRWVCFVLLKGLEQLRLWGRCIRSQFETTVCLFCFVLFLFTLLSTRIWVDCPLPSRHVEESLGISRKTMNHIDSLPNDCRCGFYPQLCVWITMSSMFKQSDGATPLSGLAPRNRFSSGVQLGQKEK